MVILIVSFETLGTMEAAKQSRVNDGIQEEPWGKELQHKFG